jgi:predicted RNA-binding protein YlxR (DUF448 family)
MNKGHNPTLQPATAHPAHQPIRTCAGCGKKFDQSTLWRLASHQGALPIWDGRKRAPGRGVWLCRKAECVERAWQRHAIERSFKLKIQTPEERAALKALQETILRALSNEYSAEKIPTER